MNKDKYLTRYTGFSTVYWMKRVQDLIQLSGDWHHEIHPECDVPKWMDELTTEVFEQIKLNAGTRPYDENIAVAGCMAIILSCWSVRIARAKAHDPRRPLKLRRRALKRVTHLAAAIHDALFDEQGDHYYFEQPWEYPYMEGATDGDFV